MNRSDALLEEARSPARSVNGVGRRRLPVILADVTVLLHAFRSDLVHHHRYRTWLDETSTAEGLLPPDAVLSDLVRIGTLPRIWSPPAPVSAVLAFVIAVRTRPATERVEDGQELWRRLDKITRADTHTRGNVVPDAYPAAAALTQNARLATRDRGFARFPACAGSIPRRAEDLQSRAGGGSEADDADSG